MSFGPTSAPFDKIPLHMKPHPRIFALVLAVLVTGVQAQQRREIKPELTIDQIMEGPDFAGTAPSNVRWAVDGKRVFFSWKTPGEKKEGTYVVEGPGRPPRRLSDDEEKTAMPVTWVENNEHTKRLFSRDGDIFMIDLGTGAQTQLTATVADESSPGFTSNPDHVFFTRESNLFLLSLATGYTEQITDIRRGPAPRDPRPTASQKYLQDQQKELFEAIRDDIDDKKIADDKKKAAVRLEPFYLESRQTTRALQLSPDEQVVSFLIDTDQEAAKTSIVPDYVTDSGYTEDIRSRNKVGDLQRKARLALIHRPQKSVVMADSGQGERGVTFSQPRWSPDGKNLTGMILSDDHKDRWIVRYDLATGKSTVLDLLHDDAWTGGPESQTLGWLPDSSAVYFVSEKTGFAHLYTVTLDGKLTQHTDGRFEVFNPFISRDGRSWYFTSSEVHSGERHFYRMPLTAVGTRNATKLTTMTGSNQATPSIDETRIANLFSYSNKPWELYVDGTAVTDSSTPEFKRYPWRDPELVMVPARDGALVPGRLYKPATAAKGAPAVIFVHGAGYAQNVHKWWASYYREYMFHNFLADRGYVVLDLDYRASAGYGRDWRTAIYRHMGGRDLTDNIDGAKYLAEKHGVDPKRIGIYGGSYGGFITLMAMFTTPDVFAAGAALRPVTDWAHYNHPYTSNILNAPQDDDEAYRRSSPIYHAQGLKGALLICHGMVDTNVHFQDSVRLVQRLIELRKENWSVAIYPVEDHGFVKPTSWADEYKRIFELFETNLKKRSGATNQ